MTSNSLLLSLILITTVLSSAAAAAFAPSISPNSSLIATILSTLGFQDLAAAAAPAKLSITTPTTIFAPTDASLRSCPSCSAPLLLQEHSLPGLYPLHYLQSFAFGTKIETFAPNRCLTITSTDTAAVNATAVKKIFINGVEIVKPDLFNNGLLIIHSLRGYVSHLSPRSCVLESMTTLSFPQQPPPTAAFLLMRRMLKEAMTSLRTGGFSIVALAMRVKYPDLSDLNYMTVFAIDDESFFAGGGEGHAYVSELGFHIVPNRLLSGANLVSLPLGTVLPTMDLGRSLTVTTAGGGGPLVPMRINYVMVKRFDMVYNNRISVHGLSTPFRHVDDRVRVMGNGQKLEISKLEFTYAYGTNYHNGS